jgi:hypothetical protein
MKILERSLHMRPPFVFLVGAVFMFAMKLQHSICQWDLLVYIDAAKAVWQGINPYNLPVKEGYENLTVLTQYVYPPLFARILSPFHWIHAEAYRFVWFFLQATAFESLYWLGLRLFGCQFSWVSWIAFHLIGIRYDGVETDFRAGNTALMEAAAISAWGSYHLARPVVSGTWLGILMSIKPLSFFLSIWDLTGRRWTAWVSGVGTLAILCLVMLSDQPLFGYFREFTGSRTFQEIMDEHTVGIFNNATVSVAFRLFTDKTIFQPLCVFPPAAYAMTFAIPTVVWLAAFSAWRRLDNSGASRDICNRYGFALLLPTVLLTTPRVADYTLVWLLVPFFFGTWQAAASRSWFSLGLYLLAGVVGNLPITGGQLNEETLELHWLHFRYVSLVLFWFAAWVAAWEAGKKT